MSYSYQNLAIDKSKINYLQKCFYVMNLIKAKDVSMWEDFQVQYELTKPEESWDFYNMLVEEYRKLSAPPVTPKKTHLKVVEKKSVAKKTPKKTAKKPAAKKAPAKKAAVKKTAKKAVKKK